MKVTLKFCEKGADGSWKPIDTPAGYPTTLEIPCDPRDTDVEGHISRAIVGYLSDNNVAWHPIELQYDYTVVPD